MTLFFRTYINTASQAIVLVNELIRRQAEGAGLSTIFGFRKFIFVSTHNSANMLTPDRISFADSFPDFVNPHFFIDNFQSSTYLNLSSISPKRFHKVLSGDRRATVKIRCYLFLAMSCEFNLPVCPIRRPTSSKADDA